mmetsp:Transcript_20702/g.48354  ORF Transcript_20702/g.48354 Transcript_20702/m.48354 type:complete len:186 (-) Transcript_20702:111-668(-)
MPHGVHHVLAEHDFFAFDRSTVKKVTSFEGEPAAPAKAVGATGATGAPAPAPSPDVRSAAQGKPASATPPEPPPPEVNEDVIAGPEAVSTQAQTETIPGGPERPSGVKGGPDHYGGLNTFLVTVSAVLVGLGLGYDHCMDAWNKYRKSSGEKEGKPSSRDSRGSVRSQGRQIGSVSQASGSRDSA